MLINAPVL